eukprot:COSAG02_NODE_1264_length_13544_cov_71.926441_5_plen_312_part_00
MVTRAMGDGYLKKSKLSQAPFKDHCPYITSTPETHELEISEDDAFIVLASDGIWDLLQNEEVVQIVGEALARKQGQVHKSLDSAGPQQLAQLVVDAALQKVCEDNLLTRSELDRLSFGSKRRKLHDDMSVIVVCLDQGIDATMRCDTTLKSTGAATCTVPVPTASKKSEETTTHDLKMQQLVMDSVSNDEQIDEPEFIDPSAARLETTKETLLPTSAANGLEPVAAMAAATYDGATDDRAGVLATDLTGNKRDVAAMGPASNTDVTSIPTDDGEPSAKRARDTSPTSTADLGSSPSAGVSATSMSPAAATT